MRTWLAIVAVVAGLAVMAMPVAQALAAWGDHAGHAQLDQDAEKAAPCVVGVCCPIPCLPAFRATNRDFVISPVAWGHPVEAEHIGQLNAPEPHPPRL